MLYNAIRVIVGLIILSLFLLVIYRSKTKNKRQWNVTAIVFSIIFTALLYIFPFENFIFTFSSPEEAYKYSRVGKLELIVRGNDTDLIISNEEGVNSIIVFPKTDNGWKIGTGVDIKISPTQVYDEFSINLIQYKNSNEYYLMIFNSSGHPLSISDNCNSTFFFDKSEYAGNSFYCTYYAYINNFDNHYKLTVNNQDISINLF